MKIPHKKIKQSLSLVLSAAILITASSVAKANTNPIGVSAKVGTLGLGVELDYAINEKFNVRLQANGYSYDDDFEEDDISYTGEIDLSSTGVLVDWRPFDGTFRVTAGLYNNANELTAIATQVGNQSYEIGDVDYRSAANDPLILDAKAELGKSSAGYLGIGWGNTAPSGWMFSFELGVLLSGSPEVSLSATGSAIGSYNGVEQQFSVSDNSNPLVQEFNENLRVEEKNLKEDISDFDVYPVISLGVGYRF